MQANYLRTANEFHAASFASWNPHKALPSAAYDSLLVAIHTVTRRRLDEIVPLVYQANLQGQISEDDANRLHEAAELRRGVFEARQRVANAKRARGPRPEKPQHPRSRWRDNRRVWSGSGPLPPSLRSLFTPGENAVAAIIRAEVRKCGVCKITYAQIAKSAGLLSTTVVKRFVRIAKAKGLIAVQEQKVAHNRNAPNIITIISADWKQWIAGTTSKKLTKAEKGGGGISVSPIQNQDIYRDMRNPQRLETARLGGSETQGLGNMGGEGIGQTAMQLLSRQGFGRTTPNQTTDRSYRGIRQGR